MGRVRTRGWPRVRMAILLRCAGWNVLRALTAMKKRGIREFAALAAASRGLFADSCRPTTAFSRPYAALRAVATPWPEIPDKFPTERVLVAA